MALVCVILHAPAPVGTKPALNYPRAAVCVAPGRGFTVQKGQAMRYLPDPCGMQGGPVAARAATPGHPGGTRRQIIAAPALIHRFTCGNDTATLQSRKLTCRQSQI